MNTFLVKIFKTYSVQQYQTAETSRPRLMPGHGKSLSTSRTKLKKSSRGTPHDVLLNTVELATE